MQWTLIICIVICTTVIALPIEVRFSDKHTNHQESPTTIDLNNASKLKRSLSWLKGFLISEKKHAEKSWKEKTLATRHQEEDEDIEALLERIRKERPSYSKSIKGIRISKHSTRQKEEDDDIEALMERIRKKRPSNRKSWKGIRISKFYTRQEEDEDEGREAVTEKNRNENKKTQTKRKPKRVRNNDNSHTNHSNDSSQTRSKSHHTSSDLRATSVESRMGESLENQQREQNSCGNRLMENCEPPCGNCEPSCSNCESMVTIVKPMTRMPMRYSYEQIDDSPQRHIVNKNSDYVVIKSNNHMPRPGYVDDRNEDGNWNVPPHDQGMYYPGHDEQYEDRIDYTIPNGGPYVDQIYPSIANHQYEEEVIYPHTIIEPHAMGLQRHVSLGPKMLPIRPMMYPGKPIVVMDTGK